MGSIKVTAVWEGLKGVLVASRGPTDPRFERAAIDSRDVQKGDLFFAVRGEREDGHDFVAQAIEAGGFGAVIERPIETPGAATLFHVSDSLHAPQPLAEWLPLHHDPKAIASTGWRGKSPGKEP